MNKPDTLSLRHAKAESLLMLYGADKLPHLGGTLLAHLIRTSELLVRWGASEDLQLAGFCHALYGTDSFEVCLIAKDRRTDIARMIGVSAEEMVYRYGSCDRDHLRRQIIGAEPPTMRNRLEGTQTVPNREMFRSFVELTAANAFDLVITNATLANQNGVKIAEDVASIRGWLSDSAVSAWAEVYPIVDWSRQIA